jgi:hypothetical protein
LKAEVQKMADLAYAQDTWKPLKRKKGVATYYQKLDNSEYLMFMVFLLDSRFSLFTLPSSPLPLHPPSSNTLLGRDRNQCSI